MDALHQLRASRKAQCDDCAEQLALAVSIYRFWTKWRDERVAAGEAVPKAVEVCIDHYGAWAKGLEDRLAEDRKIFTELTAGMHAVGLIKEGD